MWYPQDEKEVAAELSRSIGLISSHLGRQFCDSYGDRERLSVKRSTFAHNHRGKYVQRDSHGTFQESPQRGGNSGCRRRRRSGNPACGDIMAFYIKVRDGILEDVKFKTFGCGAAIAVSSMVSEMAKGKTLMKP